MKRQKLPLLDLFSGVGGMSLALSGVCRTVAYCDSSPAARAVLRHNMAAGRLARGPIFDDVTTLAARELPTPPAVLTAGFPCQDASLARARTALGIQGERTGLVRHVFRLARELAPSLQVIFLENVPNFQHKGMDETVASLRELGFRVAWGIFAASSVGAAHQRRRWYCLAVKPKAQMRRPSIQSMTADWSERVPRFRRMTPASRRDMLWRCSLLGNAVVPQCAAHACALLLEGLRQTLNPTAQVNDMHLYAPLPLTVVMDCADGGGDCGTLVRHSWNTPLANVGRLRGLNGDVRRTGELINQLFYDRSSKQFLRRRMGYKGAAANAGQHFVINPTWMEHLMGYPTGWTGNDWTGSDFVNAPR
jgi:site-specific DNA-cytosine methylase